MNYSIIIPTLNEAKFIQACLSSIRQSFPGDEIILADGGSTDNTIEIANSFDVKVINCPAGRGTQLKTGAQLSQHDLLIFIHADTIIPNNARTLVEKVFLNPAIKTATFKLAFDVEHSLLNLYSKFSTIDSIYTKFGDQCIIIRKDFYFEIGGFPEWNIFEDVALLQKARKKSQIITLNADAITSSRKFLLNGLIRNQLFNAYFFIKYFTGIKPNKIAQDYYSMTKKKNQAVIIFARHPVDGKVKTRLAKTLGNKFATDFYKSCAEHAFKQCNKLSSRTVSFLFYSDEKDKLKIKKWAGSKFVYLPQKGENLGQRMSEAFKEVFKNGFEKVVIIGTDVPDISADIISKALDSLNNSDIVIGPSNDGGYYLLGMKNFNEHIFSQIEWSTSEVFSQTIKNINNDKLNYSLLDELRDIDSESDLKIWNMKKDINKSHPVKVFLKIAYTNEN